MDYKEIYQLPISHKITYGFTANNVMALTFNYRQLTQYQIKKIIDSINSVIDARIENLKIENGMFCVNGEWIFMVRGWGHLTGSGALNLSDEKASKIQDEFIDFVFNKLST